MYVSLFVGKPFIWQIAPSTVGPWSRGLAQAVVLAYSSNSAALLSRGGIWGGEANDVQEAPLGIGCCVVLFWLSLRDIRAELPRMRLPYPSRSEASANNKCSSINTRASFHLAVLITSAWYPGFSFCSCPMGFSEWCGHLFNATGLEDA